MNNEQLTAQIKAKAAAYKAANTKTKKAEFGLPVASVGFTFATKQQAKEIESQQSDFNNVHPQW